MLKTKTKVKIGFVCVLSIAAGVQASSFVAQQVAADNPSPVNTTFQVNVVESLSVTVTTDSSESSGAINTLLRSPVTLDVATSNSNGFTASMYSDTTTDLASTNDTISTLSGTTSKASFPVNSWGYNLRNETNSNTKSSSGDNNVGETTNVNPDSAIMYSQLTTSTTVPITVMERSTAASGTQKIWFGAKADASKASGEYKNTVILSVVTGDVTESNPITPTNPDYPETDTPNDNAATYTGSTGAGATQGVGSSGYTGTTVYTTTSGGGANDTTETVNTEISGNDARNSYTAPQGVVENTASSINSGAPLATGLAVTAGVAAASGTAFFILAKRKKDDDEEEEQM